MSSKLLLNSWIISSALFKGSEISNDSYVFLRKAAINKLCFGFSDVEISTVYSCSPNNTSVFAFTFQFGSKLAAY